MPQAAMAFLQADQLLFNSSHFQSIRDRMVTRGLLPMDVSIPFVNSKNFQILNSENFTSRNGSLFILSPFQKNETLQVFDLTGKKIMEVAFNGNLAELKPYQLQNGIYFISTHSWNQKIVVGN
jgi:hypothetical protein